MGTLSHNKTIPLNTGYKDRLTVKAAGAKWMPDCKIWVATAYDIHRDAAFWLPHVDFDRLHRDSVEAMKSPNPTVWTPHLSPRQLELLAIIDVV